MKRIGLLIGFLALICAVLPPLTAQDEKKDADKAAKKAEEKKDDMKDSEKKDEKKDPEKKDEKKDPEKKDDEKKKPEAKKVEKLVFGAKLVSKILSANSESNRDLTIEQKEIDPKKVYENQIWQAQQQATLQKEQYTISTQKDARQRATQAANYQRSMAKYQIELAKKQQNIYATKPWDVRAAENVKVRSMIPPIEFDDQGFQKKWTKKELEARKDKTGLPGFPVDLDALKQGQTIEVYLAKQTAAPKNEPKKKKNADDDAPPAMERPEVVMIVILQEPVPGK